MELVNESMEMSHRMEIDQSIREKYESGLRFFPDFPEAYVHRFRANLDFQVKMGYDPPSSWHEDTDHEWTRLEEIDKPFLSPDLSLKKSFLSLKPEYYDSPPYPPPQRRHLTTPKLEIDSPYALAPICGYDESGKLVRKSDGLYALVCCFFAPYLWNDDNLQAIKAVARVFNELCSSRKNVWMQVVVKMRDPWSNDPSSAFKQFVSFFPSNNLCSFVYSTPKPSCGIDCDQICKYLNLDSDTPKFAFIDPDYKVVQHGNLSFFNYLSAHCFPFTPGKIPAKPGSLPRKFPSHLDNIFALDPSSIHISKLLGGSSPVPLSHLRDKHVALYLCCDGFFIPTLDKVHRECLLGGKEFEVVLIYIGPRHLITSIELVRCINEQLLKHNISWWVCPYMEWVTHRLQNFERVFSDEDGFTDDRLIMVGPHGCFVDPYAKSVIRSFHQIDYFPYTRDHLVNKLVEELKRLNVVSMLAQFPDISRVGGGSMVTADDLQDKIVLLYIDSVWGGEADVLRPLLHLYPRIKSSDPSCEVVFLPMDPGSATDAATLPPEVSEWLVCPFDSNVSPSIFKDLLNAGPSGTGPLYTLPTVAAFDSSGRILSLRAHEHLREGFIVPLEGDLRQEVIASFDESADYMKDMRNGGAVQM